MSKRVFFVLNRHSIKDLALKYIHSKNYLSVYIRMAHSFIQICFPSGLVQDTKTYSFDDILPVSFSFVSVALSTGTVTVPNDYQWCYLSVQCWSFSTVLAVICDLRCLALVQHMRWSLTSPLGICTWTLASCPILININQSRNCLKRDWGGGLGYPAVKLIGRRRARNL